MQGGFEPKPGAAVGPMTRLDDQFVLKRHDKPLWLPISVADALAPVIRVRRENFESRRNASAKDQAEFAECRYRPQAHFGVSPKRRWRACGLC